MSEIKYRVLVLGDFHFGESYSRAGSRIIAEKGYGHSVEYLKPFIERSDHFIINLETPIVDPSAVPSPLRGKKKYIHWADPEGTIRSLVDIGVDSVSLANNHTVDHGEEGLHATLEHLEAAGLPWFGAGRSLGEAASPYSVELPEEVGGGVLSFHGSFQYSLAHDKEFNFYAKDDNPGCFPLNRKSIENMDIRSGNLDDTFHVAFPHWGANYKWKTPGQIRLAKQLLDRDYDLVLGHGSHCVQEIDLKDDRWIVYGTGNGNFQSGGRFDSFVESEGIHPFSIWSIIEVKINKKNKRTVSIKLYPVYSDNTKTDYQPRPINSRDFGLLAEDLRKRSNVPRVLSDTFLRSGLDDLGHYIQLDLANWDFHKKPEHIATRIEPTQIGVDAVSQGDVNNSYRDQDTQVLLQQYGSGRNLGALLGASAVEKSGGDVTWIAPGSAIASVNKKQFLINGYKCDESDLGARIVQDKYLLKTFLRRVGVSTPAGDMAGTVEDAISIWSKLSCPVVVKPRLGNKGRGITVDVNSEEALRSAYERAKQVGGGVLIEEYIVPDDEYRCLSTQEECVSVVKRVLPNVTGDGTRNVQELVEAKNESRKENPALFKRYIPLDQVLDDYLQTQGFTRQTILPAGKTITVRNVGGLSSGGEPIDYTNFVGQQVLETASGAVRAVPGLTWGGADIITSLVTGQPYVIEINSDADISGAMYPVSGQPRDVAGLMTKLRLQRVNSEQITAKRPLSVATPKSVKELYLEQSSQVDATSFSIAAGVFEYLNDKGYDVTRVGRGIWRVRGHDGKERWLTSEAMGANDLSAVRRVVRRHSRVRRALGVSKVPRVIAKAVRAGGEASTFLEQLGGRAVLIKQTAEWGSSAITEVADASLLEHKLAEDRGPWLLQDDSSKGKLQVIATQQEPLVILGDLADAPNTAELTRAGARAVEAVRAIPELRWASVDILIKSSPEISSNENVRYLVAGICVNPNIDYSSRVFSGSLEDAYEHIISD